MNFMPRRVVATAVLATKAMIYGEGPCSEAAMVSIRAQGASHV
jgi:hypothetical protein